MAVTPGVPDVAPGWLGSAELPALPELPEPAGHQALAGTPRHGFGMVGSPAGRGIRATPVALGYIAPAGHEPKPVSHSTWPKRSLSALVTLGLGLAMMELASVLIPLLW